MRNRRTGILCQVTLAVSAAMAGDTHVVKMLDAPPYFEPLTVEAKVGDTVVWKNTGPHLAHIVMDEDLKLFSDDVVVGKDWSYMFKKAGVYPYVCFRHFFMRGAVVVRNADGSTDSSPEHAYQKAFREYVIPTMNAVPRMIVANHRDHSIWFTEGGGDFYGFEDIPPHNKIAQITAAGQIIEYATPTPDGDGSKVGVDSLVLDKEGNVWFTERITNRIGKLSPSGEIKEFQLPSKDGYALGVDIDSQGNLWFAERYGNRIGWMTPRGEITEIELPEKDSEPRTVFVDRQQRIWYTARVANEIGYYNTAERKLVRLQIPTKQARPAGVCQTSDGTVFFVEMVGNKIAKVVGSQIIEYSLPTKFSAPFKCAVDATDNVWFTQVYSNSIGKLEPKTGVVTEYVIPTADSRPGGIAIDAKGRVWFTEQKGNKIGVFDPSLLERPANVAAPTSDSLELGRAPVDHFRIPTRGAAPGNDLFEDADGWLWFPEIYGNKVGAIHVLTQEFREFEFPTPLSMPVGVVRDEEGLLWVPQFRGNRLASVNPATGAVTEYALPRAGVLPAAIVIDWRGDLWMPELAGNAIARFDRKTKRFEEIEMPRPESGPLQIAVASDGQLWISASEDQGNYIARFDPATRRFEVFDLPEPKSGPVGLLIDGGAVWVTEGAAGKLARLDVATRRWEEFAIPVSRSEPVRLIKDRSGRIWVADGGGLGTSGGNCLAVFDPDAKTFTLLPMEQRGAKPLGLVQTSDGNIWFTQFGANRISRLRLEGRRHASLRD